MEVKAVDILAELAQTISGAKKLLDKLIELYSAEFQTPITEMGLSNKTQNLLQKAGYSTLGDLLAANTVDLLMLPNFGRKALNEVNAILAEHGLSIRSRRQHLE